MSQARDQSVTAARGESVPGALPTPVTDARNKSRKVAPNVPVLMYHHITPAAGMICTTPDLFEDQLAGLARKGYRSLTADQFAHFLAGGHVPERSVLITFDDGYLNNWVYAHPILKRHGMTAVLFAVTGWIGEGPCRAQMGTVAPDALPWCPDHATCKTEIEAGRHDAVMARWDELASMMTDGTFEVFSHTHTHTRWDRVSPHAAAKREHMDMELAQSREMLAARLGVQSAHLCWPQGYFDADYLAAARAAGFTHLYTTDPWGQNLPYGDPSHIYRFAIRNRGASWLLRRLAIVSHPIIGPIYHRFQAWKKRRRQA